MPQKKSLKTPRFLHLFVSMLNMEKKKDTIKIDLEIERVVNFLSLGGELNKTLIFDHKLFE